MVRITRLLQVAVNGVKEEEPVKELSIEIPKENGNSGTRLIPSLSSNSPYSCLFLKRMVTQVPALYHLYPL